MTTVQLHKALLLFLISGFTFAAASEAPGVHSTLVPQIRVQPDLAPDCSSLKSIVDSVTRDCKDNDSKAIAIYNFMQLAHYHRAYPTEPGGLPTLKEFHVYGWSLCGGLHMMQAALWRQLGWRCCFVVWDGHETAEAEYDGRWHYLDVFLKFYAWMPDGKGGRTIAGEDDLNAHPKELIEDAFVLDPARKAVYARNDRYAMIGGKANWRAHEFMSCGDTLEGTIGGLKTHRNSGPLEEWMGIKQDTGTYSTDINLSPGFALTNSWDSEPDAWYWVWEGAKTTPGHTCGNHKDTRNDPGFGLILEPYIDSKQRRGYANGTLAFAPDFSSEAVLQSFVKTENVKYAEQSLLPVDAAQPSSVDVLLSSPYILTKLAAEVPESATIAISSDGGKTFTPSALDKLSEAAKGQYALQVRIGFKEALKSLKLTATIQNNAGALPYLSPGRNTVSVSVSDPKALGQNRLVVTYAYRLGSRATSYEQLCAQGKSIAQQIDATWSNTVTYIQKTFSAADLPATMIVDCPTPKGRFAVYPRMLFVRREILSPGAKPQPLPVGAVEAKSGPDDELQSLPNPFMVGAEGIPPSAP
jgi:hypothetical protein